MQSKRGAELKKKKFVFEFIFWALVMLLLVMLMGYKTGEAENAMETATSVEVITHVNE